jgi:hypothetical protein
VKCWLHSPATLFTERELPILIGLEAGVRLIYVLRGSGEISKNLLPLRGYEHLCFGLVAVPIFSLKNCPLPHHAYWLSNSLCSLKHKTYICIYLTRKFVRKKIIYRDIHLRRPCQRLLSDSKTSLLHSPATLFTEKERERDLPVFIELEAGV